MYVYIFKCVMCSHGTCVIVYMCERINKVAFFCVYMCVRMCACTCVCIFLNSCVSVTSVTRCMALRHTIGRVSMHVTCTLHLSEV